MFKCSFHRIFIDFLDICLDRRLHRASTRYQRYSRQHHYRIGCLSPFPSLSSLVVRCQINCFLNINDSRLIQPYVGVVGSIIDRSIIRIGMFSPFFYLIPPSSSRVEEKNETTRNSSRAREREECWDKKREPVVLVEDCVFMLQICINMCFDQKIEPIRVKESERVTHPERQRRPVRRSTESSVSDFLPDRSTWTRRRSTFHSVPFARGDMSKVN